MRTQISPTIPIDTIHEGYARAAIIEATALPDRRETKRDSVGMGRTNRNVTEAGLSDFLERYAHLGYSVPIALSAAMVILAASTSAGAYNNKESDGHTSEILAAIAETPVVVPFYTWEITEAVLQRRYEESLRTFEMIANKASTDPAKPEFSGQYSEQSMRNTADVDVAREVATIPEFTFYENSLAITPNHPVYGRAYEEYVRALLNIQSESVSLMDLLNAVVTYTHVNYPHNLSETVEPLKSESMVELMSRFWAGKATCADMSFLTQYGLHELGVHSVVRMYEFIASKNDLGENVPLYYVPHTNLVLRLGTPLGEDWVLETTGGFIMPLESFRKYINDTYAPSYGVINEYDVITGLE